MGAAPDRESLRRDLGLVASERQELKDHRRYRGCRVSSPSDLGRDLGLIAPERQELEDHRRDIARDTKVQT